jgi:hypothetical protein
VDALLVEQLAQGLPVGVLGRVEGHVGTGPGDHLERGVRDELGDPVADHELPAAPDLHAPEEVAVPFREVAGEGVLRLVQVVVGVEHGEIRQRGHAAVSAR